MKLKKLLIVIYLIISCYSTAQNKKWHYYFTGNDVSSIITIGDTIYAGTSGGLFIINSETLETNFVNETNSDFKGFNVTSLAKGINNEIWASVDYEGLNCFKEGKWFNYNTTNSNIQSNFLKILGVDKKNNLWFMSLQVTKGGLMMFDGNTFHVLKIFNVYHIASDTLGNLWVVSASEGVGRLDGDSLVHLNIPNLNERTIINNIFFDKQNKLFINVGGNTFNTITYDGVNWEYIEGGGGNYQMNNKGEVFTDENRDTFIPKILKLYNNKWHQYLTYSPPRNDYFWREDRFRGKFVFNHRNQVIIGVWSFYSNHGWSSFTSGPISTNITGISIQKNNSWVALSLSNTNKISDCSNIKFDSMGNLWGTTMDYKGLIKFDQTRWYHYLTNKNITNILQKNGAWSMDIDSKDNLWFLGGYNYSNSEGTSLCKLTEDSLYIYDRSNSDLPTSHINSLTVDKYDNIWLSSDYDGLIKYDGSKFTEYYVDSNDTRNNYVAGLWVDNNNNIWCTGYEYDRDRYILLKFDGEKYTKYTSDNSGLPKYYRVISMKQDFDGSIYFGTVNAPRGILIRLNTDKTWTVFDDFDSGMPKYPVQIAIDSSGNKWFAGDALIKYDNNNWVKYTPLNSALPDEFVSDVTVDKLNNIWFTTPHGIGVYNESGIKEITTVKNSNFKIVKNIKLSQNYPNPFNPTTKISYSIPVQSYVTLKIYDVLGREVANLVNEDISAGNYTVTFDASNLSSGIYFYRLQAGSFTETKKMILMR